MGLGSQLRLKTRIRIRIRIRSRYRSRSRSRRRSRIRIRIRIMIRISIRIEWPAFVAPPCNAHPPKGPLPYPRLPGLWEGVLPNFTRRFLWCRGMGVESSF